MSLPEVVSSKEYKPNFIYGKSLFTGNTLLYVSNENLKYPKSLLKNGYEWFLDFCADYKIDHTQYKFVEITQYDGATWQLDFYQSEDSTGARISLYEIYFGLRKILQAKWDIG